MFDTESEPERELRALGAEGSVRVGGCNERASPVGVWMSCRLCVCVCVFGGSVESLLSLNFAVDLKLL